MSTKPLHVTLDTNVFGLVARPDMYPTCREFAECKLIQEHIRTGAIVAYVSQAALRMEALEKEQRVNEYLREIASSTMRWNLPTAPKQRQVVLGQPSVLVFESCR